jgi:hypothetical protein
MVYFACRIPLLLCGSTSEVEKTVSSVISYKVVDIQPVQAVDGQADALPRRLLGRVLTPQDVVNLGGFFEGEKQARIYHLGQTWLLTLERDEETDEWNALPHGRDEGAYDTEIQVDRRVQRLYIP